MMFCWDPEGHYRCTKSMVSTLQVLNGTLLNCTPAFLVLRLLYIQCSITNKRNNIYKIYVYLATIANLDWHWKGSKVLFLFLSFQFWLNWYIGAMCNMTNQIESKFITVLLRTTRALRLYKVYGEHPSGSQRNIVELHSCLEQLYRVDLAHYKSYQLLYYYYYITRLTLWHSVHNNFTI